MCTSLALLSGWAVISDELKFLFSHFLSFCAKHFLCPSTVNSKLSSSVTNTESDLDTPLIHDSSGKKRGGFRTQWGHGVRKRRDEGWQVIDTPGGFSLFSRSSLPVFLILSSRLPSRTDLAAPLLPFSSSLRPQPASSLFFGSLD